MPKKPTLFTHIGMVRSRLHYDHKLGDPRPMYLRATPKMYIGWLEKDKAVKFRQETKYYGFAASRDSVAKTRNSVYFLNIDSVREATVEDHLTHYQNLVNEAYARMARLMEAAEDQSRRLIEANKAAYEASTAHDKARADLLEFSAKVLKQ